MFSESELKTPQGRFRRSVSVVFVGSIGVAAALQVLWPEAEHPASELVLSTPAAFTLLAIVIAISAYLRQVAISADEKRDVIITGGSRLYPVDSVDPRQSQCVRDRLSALERTGNNMQVAAPLTILLSIAIASRLLVETLVRRAGAEPRELRSLLAIVDTLTIAWLVVSLIWLGLLHRAARARDQRIRKEAIALLQAGRPRLRGPNAPGSTSAAHDVYGPVLQGGESRSNTAEPLGQSVRPAAVSIESLALAVTAVVLIGPAIFRRRAAARSESAEAKPDGSLV